MSALFAKNLEWLYARQAVPEAVRRGRKLACQECGERGATLGCLNQFCRYSFHLGCARHSRCSLRVYPKP